jgi:hypothetical protein
VALSQLIRVGRIAENIFHKIVGRVRLVVAGERKLQQMARHPTLRWLGRQEDLEASRTQVPAGPQG